jgi:hypothetical protein
MTKFMYIVDLGITHLENTFIRNTPVSITKYKLKGLGKNNLSLFRLT